MILLLITKTGAKKIDTTEIIYAEADGRYTRVYFLKSDKVECTNSVRSLAEIENLLPKEDFFKTYRSILMGLNHFQEFNTPDNTVLLSGGKVVGVALKRKPDFKIKLQAFIDKKNAKCC